MMMLTVFVLHSGHHSRGERDSGGGAKPGHVPLYLSDRREGRDESSLPATRGAALHRQAVQIHIGSHSRHRGGASHSSPPIE